MANKDLNKAKAAKKDEFYTRLEDIEKELKHYRPHFKGKTVLCNCDDPRCSNFFRYFTLNFEVLGLKKVIATCYKTKISICSRNTLARRRFIKSTRETRTTIGRLITKKSR